MVNEMQLCLTLCVTNKCKMFLSAIVSWWRSLDRYCVGCCVITWECFGNKEDLKRRQRFRLRSHMQFSGGWKDPCVRQRVKQQFASHCKGYIWPHSVFDKKSDSLLFCLHPLQHQCFIALWQLITGSHFWSESVEEVPQHLQTQKCLVMLLLF